MSFPLMPMVSPFSTVPTVTFLSAFTTGNSPVRSASSTAASNRFIVLATSCATNAVMTSCSINGVAAEVANSGGASFACAFVPTGATVTATPVFSSGGVANTTGMAALYAVYGLESPVWRGTAYNQSNYVYPYPSTATTSIFIPQSGVLFAPTWMNNDNQSPTFTNATLDFESDNGGGYGLATGHRDASNEATYTVSITAYAELHMGLGVLR